MKVTPRQSGPCVHPHPPHLLLSHDLTLIHRPEIELLNQNRPPQPNLEAVYIVMSTGQNVDRIVADFAGRQQYAAAHLFFIDGPSLFHWGSKDAGVIADAYA